MSKFELINASCADQTVDAVVNAANDGLWAGEMRHHRIRTQIDKP